MHSVLFVLSSQSAEYGLRVRSKEVAAKIANRPNAEVCVAFAAFHCCTPLPQMKRKKCAELVFERNMPAHCRSPVCACCCGLYAAELLRRALCSVADVKSKMQLVADAAERKTARAARITNEAMVVDPCKGGLVSWMPLSATYVRGLVFALFAFSFSIQLNE